MALAQALARNPRLLLLDEPFSALDVVTKESLRREVLAIKQQLSLPIIHVTHDLHEASLLADLVLPVEQGKAAEAWLHGVLKNRDSDVGLIPASEPLPPTPYTPESGTEKAVRRIMELPLAWSPGVLRGAACRA